MRSFESAVHAIPVMGRLSKVSRCACPPPIPTTYTSLVTPATVPRTNATYLPSGEKEGSRSRYSSGGKVSWRALELDKDNSAMAELVLPGTVWGNARSLPSGDQVSHGYCTRSMLYSL